MQHVTAPPSPGWRSSDRRRTHVGPAVGAGAVLLGSTSGHGGWAQSDDSVEEAPEQLLRRGDLGHLEDEVAAVGDDLRSDLHDLLDE